LIAVGFRSGIVKIIDANLATPIQKMKLRIGNEWIEDLKFSPDGKYLAVSSHNNCVVIYRV
jgi:WD40 repeat protein